MISGKNDFYDVAVIGAGAAGMVAAITAARNNSRVLLLEKNNKPGKKILATGNGRCNFTNDYMELSCYNGDTVLISKVLEQFSKEDTLDFFTQLGIIPKAKNGYYYPNSMQAASIADALEFELERLNITCQYDCNISDVYKADKSFVIKTADRKFCSKALVVATGLLASSKLGSDGSFFDIIKAFGHRFNKILPALCGFKASGLDFKQISGVRAEGQVSLFINGTLQAQDKGEIQFADYGISGIPVFQISSKAVKALSEEKEVKVFIDFFPEFSYEEFKAFLSSRIDGLNSDRNLASFFNGMLNQKLIKPLLKVASIPSELHPKDLSRNQIDALVGCFKKCQVKLLCSRGFDYAQVCTGGIKAQDIDEMTLQSKITDNLYFAGEIIDVDGICGGYNLQWAWSSGYVAGLNSSRNTKY